MRTLIRWPALLAALLCGIGVAEAQSAWTDCAVEGGSCSLAAPKEMRYGEPWGNRWTAPTVRGPGAIVCSNATFGDPAVGTGKRCQTRDVPTSAPAAPAGTWTGDVTFEWDAVTTNTDGTPVCGPLQYRVRLGGVAQPLTSATALTVAGLPAGTHCGTVSAVGTCGESAQSPQACKTLSEPVPTCTAPQPAAETRTQTCAAPAVGTWTQTRTYAAAAYPTCWTAGEWAPAAAPAGACVVPAPVPRVVAVVPGLSHAAVFGITAASGRGSTVLGFAPVGAACAGPVVYRYRGVGYRRLAQPADIRWWGSTATSNAAAPCQ